MPKDTMVEIRVPDLGDFSEVEVIEILVVPGQGIDLDETLIVLESDKASMEVPAQSRGTLASIVVSVGDHVNSGDLIATLNPPESNPSGSDGADEDVADETEILQPAIPSAYPPSPTGTKSEAEHTEVLVLGSGPGGYTAAFRAADLGKQVVLVERYPVLGGVCLNVGCIPSKALLHTAEVLNEAREMSKHGIEFGEPKIDLDKLRAYQAKVVTRLTTGLAGLARQRKVRIEQGSGQFIDSHTLEITHEDLTRRITFDHAIIAAGSQSVSIPGIPNDPRIVDSTGALALPKVPKRLLVIGGGIIGLELATVYHALGAQVSVVEFMDTLMTGCDPDLVRPLERRLRKQYEAIFLGTKVTEIKAQRNGLKVSFEGHNAPPTKVFDQVLVAIGRRPNGHLIGAQAAGIEVDERGFIPVDSLQRTNLAHVFAIGDIVGQPMLAHKATHQGKVAAEVCAGLKSVFEPLAIPAVAYTDPEIAWMGLTENQAKEDGISYEKAVFPWAASGRSLGMGRDEGLTKLLFDPETKRLVGAGVVGPRAGDLISEAVLALEMGADPEDLGLTIHPHPTLSETLNFAAEVAHGSVTDLYLPQSKKQ